MEISVIIESIISLFLILLVGVYGSKRNIITEEMNRGLILILLQITLPLMIFSSFILTFDPSIKSNVLSTFFYSIIAYILIIITSYLLLIPIKKDKKVILHFGNVFMNTGYVGFPILNAIYGPEGIVYGSIFNMFFVILVWTYGIMLFKGNFNKERLSIELKNILLNPSIIAVVLGMVVMVLNIKLPSALLTSIRSIGNITGPLSMIIIGTILSKVRIRDHLMDWTLYYGITTKLILIPAIVFLMSLLLGHTSKAINTVIIMSGMPASAMTSILAENYNREKDYAAVVVSVSTLLSLASVTILLQFII